MASHEASQKFYQDYEAAKAADEKLTAAQETFNNAVNAMAKEMNMNVTQINSLKARKIFRRHRKR